MQKSNHPWNPLPAAAIGDELDTTLYEAVGRALTTWELMEGLLARIFSLLCRAEFGGAERAYGAVSASSGRREMIAEALGTFPRRNDPRLLPLPNLLDRVGKFGGRRNEIAHGIVMPISDRTEPLGFFLIPAMYNSRKRLSDDAFAALRPMTTDLPWSAALKYAYNSEQIIYYHTQFFELVDDALKLADVLGDMAANDFEKGRHREFRDGGISIEDVI